MRTARQIITMTENVDPLVRKHVSSSVDEVAHTPHRKIKKAAQANVFWQALRGRAVDLARATISCLLNLLVHAAAWNMSPLTHPGTCLTNNWYIDMM